MWAVFFREARDKPLRPYPTLYKRPTTAQSTLIRLHQKGYSGFIHYIDASVELFPRR